MCVFLQYQRSLCCLPCPFYRVSFLFIFPFSTFQILILFPGSCLLFILCHCLWLPAFRPVYLICSQMYSVGRRNVLFACCLVCWACALYCIRAYLCSVFQFVGLRPRHQSNCKSDVVCVAPWANALSGLRELPRVWCESRSQESSRACQYRGIWISCRCVCAFVLVGAVQRGRHGVQRGSRRAFSNAWWRACVARGRPRFRRRSWADGESIPRLLSPSMSHAACPHLMQRLERQEIHHVVPEQ